MGLSGGCVRMVCDGREGMGFTFVINSPPKIGHWVTNSLAAWWRISMSRI